MAPEKHGLDTLGLNTSRQHLHALCDQLHLYHAVGTALEGIRSASSTKLGCMHQHYITTASHGLANRLLAAAVMVYRCSSTLLGPRKSCTSGGNRQTQLAESISI